MKDQMSIYGGGIFREAVRRVLDHHEMGPEDINRWIQVESVLSVNGRRTEPDDLELCEALLALDDMRIVAFRTLVYAHDEFTIEPLREYLRELCGLLKEGA